MSHVFVSAKDGVVEFTNTEIRNIFSSYNDLVSDDGKDDLVHNLIIPDITSVAVRQISDLLRTRCAFSFNQEGVEDIQEAALVFGIDSNISVKKFMSAEGTIILMVTSDKDVLETSGQKIQEKIDREEEIESESEYLDYKDEDTNENKMKLENEELINDKKKLEDQILTMETKKSTLKTELEVKNNIIEGNLHKIQRLEHKMNKNELEYKDLLEEEKQKYINIKNEHDNLECEADGLRKKYEESKSRIKGLEEKINKNKAEYRGLSLEERLAYSNLKRSMIN